jgi:alpha-methylacyl-CoA racemase
VTPLAGLRVVEFASIGSGPHAAMLLSDLGAEVLRVERVGGGFRNAVLDRPYLSRAEHLLRQVGRA